METNANAKAQLTKRQIAYLTLTILTVGFLGGLLSARVGSPEPRAASSVETSEVSDPQKALEYQNCTEFCQGYKRNFCAMAMRLFKTPGGDDFEPPLRVKLTRESPALDHTTLELTGQRAKEFADAFHIVPAREPVQFEDGIMNLREHVDPWLCSRTWIYMEWPRQRIERLHVLDDVAVVYHASPIASELTARSSTYIRRLFGDQSTCTASKYQPRTRGTDPCYFP